MKNGIDISKWQGAPDWDKLAAAHRAGRLDFVILRAGYGANTIDPTFAANYAAATARGIPVGAYWYAYWRQATPAQEAAAFVAAVQGKTLQYGVWYDVEYEKSITSLSKSARTDRVLQALAVLAASGRYCGLYASTDMINNRLEYDRLRAYDVWAAQYGSKCTCKLPYGLWQYSSTGSADGISGNVDCDRAYKDYPAIVTGALATGKAAAVGNGDASGGQAGSGGGEAGSIGKPGSGSENETAGQPGAGGGSEAGGQAGVGGVDVAGQPDTTPTAPDTGEPRVTKTLRYKLATGGDLRMLLDNAQELSLYAVGSVDIGPMTEVNAAKMEALGASLGLDMQEV